MSKERIELSLDPETIKLLRTAAIKKYGNLRSVSRLVEDLATATTEPKEVFEGSHIISHNGVDIGGLYPESLTVRLMGIRISLKEIAEMRERKGRPAEHILEGIEFLDELIDAIMKGICNGSLDRFGWCPSCSGYTKNADGSYSPDEDIKYPEGQACQNPRVLS